MVFFRTIFSFCCYARTTVVGEYAIVHHLVEGVVPTDMRVMLPTDSAAAPVMVMVLPLIAPVELSDAPLQVMVMVPVVDDVNVFTKPGPGAAERM